MSAQKSRIQAGDASIEEGERQRRQQAQIPLKIQERSSLDEKTASIMARIRGKAVARLVEHQEFEIPEALLGSFTVHAF